MQGIDYTKVPIPTFAKEWFFDHAPPHDSTLKVQSDFWLGTIAKIPRLSDVEKYKQLIALDLKTCWITLEILRTLLVLKC